MNIVNYLTPADERTRKKVIEDITHNYSFVKTECIGKSRCQRSIDAICIGSNKSRVLLCGGVHGSEWITSSILLMFVHRLCDAISGHKRISSLAIGRYMLSRGVMIVPCLNPDGVEIAIHGAECACQYTPMVKKLYNRGIWQANAAGVDINHNFPAGWDELHKLEIKTGITSPSNTRFGGFKPASEPETISIMELCCKIPFRHALAFHSQGQEIYWKYGDFIPPTSERTAKLLSRSSGYTLSEPEGLAVGGGFKDWFITRFMRPAFTIEVGLGKNPLPAEDLTDIYGKIEEMIALSIIV